MKVEKIEKIIGKKIQYFKEIDSTHLYAKRVAEKEENNNIIIAEMQTKGIGTKGRKWYTGERKKHSYDNYFKATM